MCAHKPAPGGKSSIVSYQPNKGDTLVEGFEFSQGLVHRLDESLVQDRDVHLVTDCEGVGGLSVE